LPLRGTSWRLLAISANREAALSDDVVLTIKEVAALLKIGEKTAYTMAQTGELPCFKVRGQWRFRRDDIFAWIEEQKRASGSTTRQEGE